MYQNKFQEAKSIILYGSTLYNSATLCLFLGIIYYRLDKFAESEEVLLEGNLLNPCHADIWAYLCMVCIAQGYSRIPEVEEIVFSKPYNWVRMIQISCVRLRQLSFPWISFRLQKI